MKTINSLILSLATLFVLGACEGPTLQIMVKRLPIQPTAV